MQPDKPQKGDIIVVDKSEWYALGDGEELQVCELNGWGEEGRDISVVPRKELHTGRSFWGPQNAHCGGREYMSTSGGPWKTVTLSLIPHLEYVGKVMNTFWKWKSYPCAGGGENYQREVNQWRLSVLPDRTYLSPFDGKMY